MSLLAGLDPKNDVRNIKVSSDGEIKTTSASVEGANNGTCVLTVVDNDYLVTTTNMKVGTYTIAAQPKGSHVVTVATTAVGAADTQGTITIVGKDSDNADITEVLTPVAGSTVTGELGFESVTSITGAGWVINEGNDTIVVGVGAIKPPTGKYIFAIVPVTDTVLAAVTFAEGSLAPKLTGLTALKAGQAYYGRFATITLTSGEAVVYYKKL